MSILDLVLSVPSSFFWMVVLLLAGFSPCLDQTGPVCWQDTGTCLSELIVLALSLTSLQSLAQLYGSQVTFSCVPLFYVFSLFLNLFISLHDICIISNSFLCVTSKHFLCLTTSFLYVPSWFLYYSLKYQHRR